MKRPPLYFLPAEYLPPSSASRMTRKSDTAAARSAFLADPFPNLDALLESRYAWMNEALVDARTLYELGSGAGFARRYIHNPNLKLTDVTPQPWIDAVVDAEHLPFDDASVDGLIACQMLHHVPRPSLFLHEAARVLKPGGTLLILDPEASFFCRLILRIMRQEGWSLLRDPFDDQQVCKNPDDPWSGNNAVLTLLLADRERFCLTFPRLRIVSTQPCELFLFLLSGGVTGKTVTVRLPRRILRWIKALDDKLTAWAPSLFALQRRVTIEKI